jgi:PLP dependent protein
MSVSENWSRLRARAAAAAERVGRRPEDVTIIAVSKTFPAEKVREAYNAGLRIFGENYVQEALDKISGLPSDVEWHMIGHVQSNKARHIASRFALIHSVDSIGFEPSNTLDAAAEIAALDHLELRGLMTIGPLARRPEDVRWVFKELHKLRDTVQVRLPGMDLRELSMGMTGDFEVAIEEGATLVRVGRAIFGDRQP